MKKKILLIGHSSLAAGGAEDEFERLLKHFSSKKNEYEIYAMFPDGPKANTFKKFCVEYSLYPMGFFPVTPVRIQDYLFFIKLYFTQRNAISFFMKKRKFDLCIINVVVLVWPVLFLKKNRNIILFIRESIQPKIFRNIIYKILCKYVTHFIAVSDEIKNDFLKLTTNNKNISVLYSSVEKINFTNPIARLDIDGSIEENQLESLLNVDNFNMICVGAIYDRKNQFLILESLKELKKRNKKIPNIFFVGDKNVDLKYYHKMLEFIKDEYLVNNCFFCGTLEKKIYYKLLLFINAIIISSKSEGLPLVISEALQMKIPLISTKAGGIPDIIKNDINGILINEDKNELANAIIKVMDIKFSSKITEAGYKTYQEKLNLKNNFRTLDLICDNLVKGG